MREAQGQNFYSKVQLLGVNCRPGVPSRTKGGGAEVSASLTFFLPDNSLGLWGKKRIMTPPHTSPGAGG